MVKKLNKTNNFLAVLIVSILLVGTVLPAANAEDIKYNEGFDKGPSYTNVVPIEKVTFVGYDEESYLDDYAYLAAVPTAVFRDNSKLYSHPLLFYQEKLDYDDDKYRPLDTYPGIDYFMEDWMGYCNGQLDQMTLINVPKNVLDEEWDAKEYVMIEGENPYAIASQLALQDWSYSNDAVVAVIDDEYEKPDSTETEGVVKGTIPAGYEKDQITFEMEKPAIGVGGNYKSFEITEPYKYVIANMYWDNVLVDLDLQLYDNQLGMADADSKWNVFYGAGEVASSYVYNYGKWEVGVTYMPTQSLSSDEGKMGSLYNVDEFKTTGLFGNKADTQDVIVDLYPGVEVYLDQDTPFGCRNVEFKLTWENPNVALGFIILDTFGAETASVPSNDKIVEGLERGKTELTIEIEKFGETTGDKKYKICVFALDDIDSPLDFEIEYSWQQNITRFEGDCLASATEGAVLASSLNAPLLYITKDSIPQSTEDALYKLGIENICLVNLGGYLSNEVKEQLKDIADVKEYTEYKEIYDKIKDISGSNDIIFSTIDPWSYYYAPEQVPVGEYPGSLFIGPAAYIAAQHGSPVLLVDNHPELSQAIVWHTKFWQDTANIPVRPNLPSVACMVLTGRSVIEFLESYDFELPKEKDNLATMITVADGFDIGITWDRTFTGRLIPGRFCSSPVDIAYWMARSTFYPALIFENPATGTVKLEQGSESTVKPIIGKFMNPRGTDLVITKDNKVEEFEYPILHTYNVYLYNFNRDAAAHWGGPYTTANGITPYETPSPHSIDVGTTDKVGAFYPDIHETEVTPIYAEKAGYSNVFSTNFDVAMANLNEGVIMWMESCHGGNGGYGRLGFWNSDSPYIDEPNPWRAYERPMMAINNIDELVQFMPGYLEEEGMPSMTLLFKLSRLFTKPLNFFLIDRGATDNPDTAVMNTDFPITLIHDAFGVDLNIKESKGLSLIPIIGRQFRTMGRNGEGSDGIVINPTFAGENVLIKYNGIDFDDNLDNLHSMGMNAVSCLVANTYLHQALIRHGTAYQILDPWSTSWYSGIWLHSIPRQLALGYTIGEAYEQGMAEVGIQYLVDQWWWDLNENVLFYGDPDQRVWTPSTEYSDENYWEREDVEALTYDETISLNGHMPYGANSHPHEKQPKSILEKNFLLIIIIIIAILLIIALLVGRKKPKK